MNQANYKAIAEIIRKWNNMGICKEDVLPNMLADYFEKEAMKQPNVYDIETTQKIFNRQQFLKDCGVSE